jgi:hypothetical protein
MGYLKYVHMVLEETMLNKLKQSVKNPFTYVFIVGVLAANQGLYYDWVSKTAEVIKVKHDYAEFTESYRKAYEPTIAEARKVLAKKEKTNSEFKASENENTLKN